MIQLIALWLFVTSLAGLSFAALLMEERHEREREVERLRFHERTSPEAWRVRLMPFDQDAVS